MKQKVFKGPRQSKVSQVGHGLGLHHLLEEFNGTSIQGDEGSQNASEKHPKIDRKIDR